MIIYNFISKESMMTNTNPEQILIQGLNELNIEYTQNMIDMFNNYLELYMIRNAETNLSAIRNEKETVIKHFLDSLSPIHILEKYLSKHNKIVDLGSGGGFPGIPLKIIKPEWNIDIAEVNKKKISFMNEVLEKLNINDISIIDSSQEKIIKQYDIVLSRAFGKFEKNITEARKYLKSKGFIILYKATKEKIQQELASSKNIKIGTKHKIDIYNLDVPFLEGERNLMIISDLL